RLLAHLGIDRLLAAVGGSLGGMQVLQWLTQAPEQVTNGVMIASSSRLAAQNIAFSAVGREAITRDADIHDGRYFELDGPASQGPKIGLAIARMMAHITYLSEEAMTEKFGRRLQDKSGDQRMGFGVDFEVESYLNYQGRTFLDRFDALSYLYL